MKKVLLQIKNNLKKPLSPVRVLVIAGLLVYLPLWLWTIHAAAIQGGDIYGTLPVLGSDSIEYTTLAQNLINKACFSLKDCASPETFRAPGYPVFIALFFYIFKSLFAVTLLQCFLTLLSAYFIQRILSRYVSAHLSIYAMILFVIEPSVVLHSLVILSDIPYVFLITLVFFLLMRSRPTVTVCMWIGILTGLSILFRPISMFLPPVLIFTYWYMYGLSIKEILKVVSLITLFSFIAVFPWILRNYVRTGAIGISSVSSFNLLYYNVPIFLSYKEGISVEDAQKKLVLESGMNTEAWHKLENSAIVSRLAQKYIKANFFSYMKFHLIKTGPFFFSSSIKNAVYSYNMLYDTDIDYQHDTAPISDTLLHGDFKTFAHRLWAESVFLVERLVWLLIYFMVFCGLFSKKRKIVFISIIFIFYFAVLTGPVSYARYRLPVEPFLFIGLPIGGLVFYENSRKIYYLILQKANLRK